MRKCLGNHSCMSSTLPIVILNGTRFFLRYLLFFDLVLAEVSPIKNKTIILIKYLLLSTWCAYICLFSQLARKLFLLYSVYQGSLLPGSWELRIRLAILRVSAVLLTMQAITIADTSTADHSGLVTSPADDAHYGAFFVFADGSNYTESPAADASSNVFEQLVASARAHVGRSRSDAWLVLATLLLHLRVFEEATATSSRQGNIYTAVYKHFCKLA